MRESVDTLPWTSLTDGEVAQSDVRIGADASDLLSLVEILEFAVILGSNLEELFSSGSSELKSDEPVAPTRPSSVACLSVSTCVRLCPRQDFVEFIEWPKFFLLNNTKFTI